jgi:isopentenyl phosphate kinase
VILTKNGRIHSFEETLLRRTLEMRFLPVMYGDAVLDTDIGFTILSGDQLTSALAMRFNAERIVIGVDVDGLCDGDPKAGKAEVLEHLTLNELKQIQHKLVKPTTADVTEGMYGKVSELIPALELGIPTTIVNATEPDRVYCALTGQKVKGTLIEKE